MRASLQPLLLARGQSLGWDLLLLALRRPARRCTRPCGSHCAPTSCTLTRASPPRSEQSTLPPRGRSPWWLCGRLTFQDGDVDLWHGDGLVHGGARVTAAKALGSRGLLALPVAVLFMAFFSPEGIKALQGKPSALGAGTSSLSCCQTVWCPCTGPPRSWAGQTVCFPWARAALALGEFWDPT